jgi:hypothetical protein
VLTFWLATASAEVDSRRRRSVGASVVPIADEVAAAALIMARASSGSTTRIPLLRRTVQAPADSPRLFA